MGPEEEEYQNGSLDSIRELGEDMNRFTLPDEDEGEADEGEDE